MSLFNFLTVHLQTESLTFPWTNNSLRRIVQYGDNSLLWSPTEANEPHPKFGLVIETDDVMHTTEGYERLLTYIIESLGREGRPLEQLWNGSREQGKVAGLVFIVVWGRTRRRVSGCRQRIVRFKSPIGAKGGRRRLSYQLARRWGTRGRERGETQKLSVVKHQKLKWDSLLNLPMVIVYIKSN